MLFYDMKKTAAKYIKKLFIRYLWTVDTFNGVDTVTKGRATIIPEPQNNLIISGWLFDSKEDDNITRFSIEIDGQHFPTLYGLIRTDVSFAYKRQEYRNSGFRCVIPKNHFQNDKIYPVNFRITTKNNKTKNIVTSVSFLINEEKGRRQSYDSDEQLEYSQYRGELLSLQHIQGTGIEIGALHAPLSVDTTKAKVLYVDRLPQKELYAQYPEFKKYDIVAADIIDNGDELTTISDCAYDFCISNHVLEHIEDPLTALFNWLRVLKPGGVLYLSVPLPDNIVDRHRQPTTIAHILNDYKLFAKNSSKFLSNRHAHFEDFVQGTHHNERHNDEFIANKVDALININYSIHFHVFTAETLHQMFDFVAKTVQLKILEFVNNDPEEFILIVEKHDVVH